MTHRSLAALIVLNVVLFAGLVVTFLGPAPREASAQFGGGQQYTMIAGTVSGGADQAAVYIMDISTGRLAAVRFNSANSKFEGGVAGRAIAEDIGQTGTGR